MGGDYSVQRNTVASLLCEPPIVPLAMIRLAKEQPCVVAQESTRDIGCRGGNQHARVLLDILKSDRSL